MACCPSRSWGGGASPRLRVGETPLCSLYVVKASRTTSCREAHLLLGNKSSCVHSPWSTPESCSGCKVDDFPWSPKVANRVTHLLSVSLPVSAWHSDHRPVGTGFWSCGDFPADPAGAPAPPCSRAGLCTQPSAPLTQAPGAPQGSWGSWSL